LRERVGPQGARVLGADDARQGRRRCEAEGVTPKAGFPGVAEVSPATREVVPTGRRCHPWPRGYGTSGDLLERRTKRHASGER
jgi:hypothetical protein